jgi:hypothetical protein
MARYLYPFAIVILVLVVLSHLLGMTSPDVSHGSYRVAVQVGATPTVDTPSTGEAHGHPCWDETPPLGRLLETVFSVEAFLYRLVGFPGEQAVSPSRPLANCVSLTGMH